MLKNLMLDVATGRAESQTDEIVVYLYDRQELAMMIGETNE